MTPSPTQTLTPPPGPHRTRRDLRETRPASAEWLWHWVRAYTGVKVARAPVCRGHSPPLDWLAELWLKRPDLLVVVGARGSGKSFLTGLLSHVESRFHPGLGTRVLGGSKAQSMQTYEALGSAVRDGRGPGGSDADTLERLLSDKAVYRNGSQVGILAASPTSVRGPHVQTLRLDEVDEIDPPLREAALGMCMAGRGVRASVSMASTFHKLAGPVAGLIERSEAGAFPLHTTCTFDVLERCPESRSGPYVGGEALYENCPGCPIRKWCHAERDRNGGEALAKLADGHYAIDSLVQKARHASAGTFAADYLCSGPRPDGLWFPAFSRASHVRLDAEYDPAWPVHLAVDSGVFTGAVFFQVRRWPGAAPAVTRDEVTVFGDYLSEGATAEADARALVERARVLCHGRLDTVSTDPAGGARNPVGPTVLAEFARAGLPLRRWPVAPVADGLALLDSFVTPAAGPATLSVHPRCTALVTGLLHYRRAKRGGEWMDYPLDPQHPAEDLVDALRGGLVNAFPGGRRPAAKFTPVSSARFAY